MPVFLHGKSLRIRLVLLVLAAAIPSLCLIAFEGWHSRQQALNAASKEVLNLSASLAAMQTALTDSTRQLLDTLAQTPAIQTGDALKVQPMLASVQGKAPHYANILAARPNGDVYSAAKGFTPINSADRRHFRDALATGAFSPGEYIVSRTVQKPGFPFANPVFDENKRLVGMLMATVDLSQFSRLFTEAKLPEGSIMGIIDHKGTRLFIYPAQEHANPVGQPMRAVYFNTIKDAKPDTPYDMVGADGRERIYGFRSLRLSPESQPYMYVFVGLPKAAVLAQADAVTSRNFAFLGVGLSAALVVAWWLGQVFIGRKFARLKDFAGRLRQGQFHSRSTLAESPDEFGQLAAAFNDMAEGITKHLQAEQDARNELAESERKLRLVTDFNSDWAFWRGNQGEILWIAPSCLQVTGYSAEAFLSKPCLAEEIVHHDDRSFLEQHLEDIAAGDNRPHSLDFRIYHQKGHVVWINHQCVPIVDEHGNTLGRRVSNRDITERKAAEEELRLAARIFDDSIQGVVITGRDGRIQRVNPSFTAITGYSDKEVIGLTPRVLKSGRHPASFYTTMWQTIIGQGQWSGEIWNRRKSGEIYPEWLSITSIRDDRGRITHFVAIFHDITEVKRHQQALQHQAEHDALTGLPNRLLFEDRLSMAINQCKRHHRKLAVLFIDLDHFKHVNDSLGHSVGDLLLIELAKRLEAGMREQDTVARLGGDEFIVLLSDVDQAEEAAHAAQRILDLLREPFTLGELEFYATASLGLTVYPEDGELGGELVKNADLAMYKAKAMGRNSYQFFDSEMETKAKARLALEAHLQRALRNNEFEVFYQPLTDIRTGRISGAEALVRWRSADGYIGPSEFIPVAEETGLIIPLGEWVLKTACKQMQDFRTRLLPHISVAVNFSSRQFAAGDVAALVQSALAQSGLPPEALHIEITESVLLANVNSVARQLDSLKSLGVTCQLDDFGTGYSSMAYLKRLPIDGLKIDQSFVSDIETNADSLAIATSIVSLATAMGLGLVAEGIETQGQYDILENMGVHTAQGYLIAKPMNAADFEAFVRLRMPHMALA